jgi:hypothetical protein
VLASLIAGMSLLQAMAAHRAKQWTLDTCVPKGREAGVDFREFVSLLGDLPPASSYSGDVIRHLKEQENAIREALVASGELRTGRV